jgi:DNA-binding response OmpR family regulator
VRAIIVLADDEPDLRSIYAACLRNEGYEVWEASDGREALALVDARRPDLLLLDVWMPVLNGLEVVEHLRNDPHSGQMRIVMLSNLGDSDTRLEGYSAGVSDYWVKGLSLAELNRRVRQSLSEARVELVCDVVESPAVDRNANAKAIRPVST